MDASPPRRGTGQRDAILSRVRTALQMPTSEHVKRDRHPAGASSLGTDTPVGVSHGSFSTMLPPVGPGVDERIAAFAERSALLKTHFHVVPTIEAAASLMSDLASTHSWHRVACQRHPEIERVASALSIDRLTIDQGYDRNALEQCDAGLTVCDALVAQTGSVLLTATSAGGRALSVLPPHHVVIATADQLLPDLPAAYALFEQRYRDNWPSFATFITGPSRTGDIERILVLGAHGPKQLTVILVHPT